MGRRIDVVVLIENVIFVLEFKVGESEFLANNFISFGLCRLHLKSFHETSHKHLLKYLILIADRNKEHFPKYFNNIPQRQSIISNKDKYIIIKRKKQ